MADRERWPIARLHYRVNIRKIYAQKDSSGWTKAEAWVKVIDIPAVVLHFSKRGVNAIEPLSTSQSTLFMTPAGMRDNRSKHADTFHHVQIGNLRPARQDLLPIPPCNPHLNTAV